MISGGNATVFVSSMDDAVSFYTGVLGLRLTNCFGDEQIQSWTAKPDALPRWKILTVMCLWETILDTAGN